MPLLLVAMPVAAQPAREAFVDGLLGRMTLEEKLGQLNMLPGRWNQTGPTVAGGEQADVAAGRVGAFLSFWGAGPTRRVQQVAVEQSRLGIPLLFAQDVIHGFRTIFPVPLAEAASWDTALVRRAAAVAAYEASGYGLHWTFAPMVDLARDPRWGRIVEGSGEDPFLGAAFAAARVRGFQGGSLGLDSSIAACVKHFAAYGAAEGGRDYNVAEVSERALLEMYLPPYEAAVKAGAATVMASFNEVAGVPMHANDRLLGGVLREGWGFRGLVVSDWTGVMELGPHGIAGTRLEAGRRSLAAGVDMDMSSRIYVDSLAPAVRDERIPVAQVDEAVRRVLRLKYDLGLFADPYRYSDSLRQIARTLTPDNRAVARRLAERSLVLLKNAPGAGGLPLLPLDRSRIRRLAVIGSLADDGRSTMGNWAGAGRAEEAVTILAGLRAALPGVDVRYRLGARPWGDTTAYIAPAVEAARWADAVVLVVGEDQDMSAEARNRTSLDLPGAQQALADAVLATGKPVVVVLMNGRPLSVQRLHNTAPAILEAWFPGTEGGHAVAAALLGDVNPSGKLTTTFPRTVGQVPLYYNHRRTGRPPTDESRYTSKYIDAPWTPLYVFGHGLSYTTFGYGNLRTSTAQVPPMGTLTVSVDVTNTGARAGEEVVQLYLRDDVASVTQPVRRLRGFWRVQLAPGETQTVTFTLGPDDFMLYDAHLQRTVEPGTFTVFAGGSSEAMLATQFEVTR